MADTRTNLIHGWVSAPNTRGTMDILWSCIITVFLCSWSVLYLNVSGNHGRRPSLLNKLSWVVFTIFFPEILATFAQNQWLSAQYSVSEFQNNDSIGWSLTHGFFADMGGFVLHPPDYPPFPVSAQQIHYLVSHSFMEFPNIDRETIWDRNKADGFVRTIIFIQIIWFASQCIWRGFQYSLISTLELDVVAIVLCTFPTLYFWLHKPLDVTTPITLHLKDGVLVCNILQSAEGSARIPFRKTPLDFVSPAPDPYEILDPIMWALELVLGIGADPDHGPINTFKNTSRMNPGKVRVIDVGVSSTITLTFIGIHFLAWNFEYPTTIERQLSRGACVALLGCAISFATLWILMTWQLPTICRLSGIPQVHTATQLCKEMHWLFQYTLSISHIGLYGIARLFVIGEALAGLRALPAGIFRNVQWPSFLANI
jgi:hypothetical protein